MCKNSPFSMIFIEFLVKNSKLRYHGNEHGKIRVPIGLFFLFGSRRTRSESLMKICD